MIKLTNTQWYIILERIKTEHPVSVWAIGRKQREVLGFTVRGYKDYPELGKNKHGEQYYGRPEEGVYLDFWNDAQETFFSMKYLNL
jgi:hypothetical protein